MASKKKSASASSTTPPSAFAPDAYGLRFLKKGFAKTAEDDVLFAHGYPHIVIATDDPMPDDDVDTLYKKFPTHTIKVPRAFLPRYFACNGCGADKDGIKRAKSRLPSGPSLESCAECGAKIPEARQQAIPGVRLCVACQEKEDREVVNNAGYNRRGSKDSQLR